MRSGRETDARIAREIFGRDVVVKNDLPHERTETGDRVLRPYSTEMGSAWDVVAKMRISLIPIEGGQWFAFAGDLEGWDSPEHFLDFLKQGDFRHCGASLGLEPALVVCEAALRAHEKMNRPHLHLAPPPVETGAAVRAVESEILH